MIQTSVWILVPSFFQSTNPDSVSPVLGIGNVRWLGKGPILQDSVWKGRQRSEPATQYCILKASTQLCVSSGDWPPGEVRGHFLEEVTLVLGSQRMRSFSGRSSRQNVISKGQRDHGVPAILCGHSLRCKVEMGTTVKGWGRRGWGPWLWVCHVWPTFCALRGAKGI